MGANDMDKKFVRGDLIKLKSWDAWYPVGWARDDIGIVAGKSDSGVHAIVYNMRTLDVVNCPVPTMLHLFRSIP
jgi:hypothetical protein